MKHPNPYSTAVRRWATWRAHPSVTPIVSGLAMISLIVVLTTLSLTAEPQPAQANLQPTAVSQSLAAAMGVTQPTIHTGVAAPPTPRENLVAEKATARRISLAYLEAQRVAAVKRKAVAAAVKRKAVAAVKRKAKANKVTKTNKAKAAPSGSMWNRLAKCEAGGNWHINTGNGYYGGVQFSASTWRAYGGAKFAATADKASREQQIAIAEKVKAAAGMNSWPACSRKLGLL